MDWSLNDKCPLNVCCSEYVPWVLKLSIFTHLDSDLASAVLLKSSAATKR